MKKALSLFVAVFLGMSGAFADAPAEKRPEMLDYIAKLKAQEYVRELVRLKLELMSYPSDSKASEIQVNRERVDAINRELANLVIVPIQIRKKEIEKKVEGQKGVMSGENPVILGLKAEIVACDLQIERAKAELEGLRDNK